MVKSFVPIVFKGYNEFSYNIADVVITLDRYILLHESATLNISYNSASVQGSKDSKYLIFFKPAADSSSLLCLFQFLPPPGSGFKNTSTVNVSIVLSNNSGYTSIIYGVLLNSCHWLNGSKFSVQTTPGHVYKKVIMYDGANDSLIKRRQTTFCYCDSITNDVDCIVDQFGPIYPGQSIPINLKQVAPYSVMAVVPVTPLPPVHLSTCTLVSYLPSSWVHLVDTNCTPLFYRVLSTTLQSCSVTFRVTAQFNHSFYQYHIDFKKCPHGFQIYNGSCTCNRLLTKVFPNLKCDIETQVFNRPAKAWIGFLNNQGHGSILYAKLCIRAVCKNKPSEVHLDNPDTQCVGNRVGMICGQCPPGFDSVFGSFNCKRCSNYTLMLLPGFFIAGILLVCLLFILNLTVVDGKINGFILYVNLVRGNAYDALPSNSFMFVLLSIFNLDLGIETCFYHGMTEYDKTWLQFAFPMYLLLIVAMLAVISRYCGPIEKLTRKKVIPVIATIFLLSYSKLLLVTAKALFSYTTIHQIHGNTNNSKLLLVTAKALFSYTTIHQIHGNKIETTQIWMWDSAIPLFGFKFSTLFAFSLIIFLSALMPLNFLLLFTKMSYRFKFVCNYLKPYLDAYQAPFKDSCHYYFGVELLIRPFLFVLGNRGLLGSYTTLGVNTFICMVLLIYLCVFKPFKNIVNTMVYISYAFNIGCLLVLVICFGINQDRKLYTTLLNMLILTAVTEFTFTVIYYLYINYLYKINKLSTFIVKVSDLIMKVHKGFTNRPQGTSPPLLPVASYEQFQEELLTINPDK